MTDQQQENQQNLDDDTTQQIDCCHPGALLKEAREAKGLTVEEVAQKLNFLPAYVSALENEQFDVVHSNTFVKGYLRAYARFLGIDAEEVLRCLFAHYPEMAVPEQTRPVQSLKPEKNTSSLLFKLFTLLVVVALISIIILWWQSRSTENLPGASSHEIKVETLNGQTIIAPMNQRPAEEAEAATPADAAALSSEAEAQQAITEPAKDLAPAPAEPTQQAAITPVAEIPAPRPAPLRTLAPGTDIAAVTQGNDRLIALSFSGDCWTEVRDQSDRMLHAGLMREGEALLLEGQPPFRMVFGYGPAVSIYYKGEAYDFTSRIRPNGYASIRVD